MDAVQKANSGHPGTPMALGAAGLRALHARHEAQPAEPATGPTATASCCPPAMRRCSSTRRSTWRATALTLDDLKNFRQLGQPDGRPPRVPGHDAPAIEATTGPLGQGLAMSVGMALAERMLAARFNGDGHEIVDHHTYVIASDGDIQEGVGSEACSLAGHLGLGKLIVFYDNNHIQLAGPTDADFSARTSGKRYEAYGWHVQDVGEDLSVETLESATEEAKGVDGQALARHRAARTSATARPNKQDTDQAHGSPLGEDEVQGHQGGLRLAAGQDLLRAGRGARALPGGRRARPAGRGGVGASSWPLPRRQLRRRRRARPDHERPAPAGRLGRGPADVRPGRRQDGHAEGVGRGDPVGGRAGCRT